MVLNKIDPLTKVAFPNEILQNAKKSVVNVLTSKIPSSRAHELSKKDKNVGSINTSVGKGGYVASRQIANASIQSSMINSNAHAPSDNNKF